MTKSKIQSVTKCATSLINFNWNVYPSSVAGHEGPRQKGWCSAMLKPMSSSSSKAQTCCCCMCCVHKAVLAEAEKCWGFLAGKSLLGTTGPLSSAPANSRLEIQVKGWRALAKLDGWEWASDEIDFCACFFVQSTESGRVHVTKVHTFGQVKRN